MSGNVEAHTAAMRKEDPTDAESVFFHRLVSQLRGAQDWYHRDPDGAPWMIASVDVVGDEGVTTTWRCDYDGHRLLAGRSPANLNWDDGVRATDAGISVSGADGLDVVESDPGRAADVAATWFKARLAAS